jgi:hypothetical protein
MANQARGRVSGGRYIALSGIAPNALPTVTQSCTLPDGISGLCSFTQLADGAGFQLAHPLTAELHALRHLIQCEGVCAP